jgi:conjugative transfer signal peptidase TraF
MVGGDASSIDVGNFRVKSLVLLAAVGALGAIALSPVSPPPWIVWNASRSAPVGLYGVQAMAPGVGDLALVRLPTDLAALANRHSYLHGTDYVLKPVAAIAGDTVCRSGLVITVRGVVAALAKQRDGAGRPMPFWNGCHVLEPGDLFLVSPPPNSFDSRYFGSVAKTHVIGSAHAVWTFPNTIE